MAEFKPPHTNGNGHARADAHGSDNGHVHAHNGGNGHRRRVRHQIHHGLRRAVLRADTAVTLIETCGMSVTEAIERCNISSAYFYAMRAVRESGDTDLHDAVLRDETPLFPSAKRVKNAAAAIKAYRKCSLFEQGMVWLATGATTDAVTLLRSLTPDQLAELGQLLGTEWTWDLLISPVLSSKPATEPAVVTVQSNGNGSRKD